MARLKRSEKGNGNENANVGEELTAELAVLEIQPVVRMGIEPGITALIIQSVVREGIEPGITVLQIQLVFRGEMNPGLSCYKSSWLSGGRGN